MRKRLSLALLLILAASPAHACDCHPEQGPLAARVRAAVTNATAVFSAEVVEVENFALWPEHFQETRLRVIEAWKGVVPGRTLIRTLTQTDCCLCGLQFKKGERLLVYVSGAEPYRLDDCSRTRILTDAQAEIAVLRRLGNSDRARR